MVIGFIKNEIAVQQSLHCTSNRQRQEATTSQHMATNLGTQKMANGGGSKRVQTYNSRGIIGA